MVAVIMVILWLRVRMRLVRRVVWLRLGWGWVVWLRLGWVVLRLGSIIFRLRRIVRFWSRFGMWLIILGLGFRVGWIVDRSGLRVRFRVGWIVSRSGLRIRWIINWLRLGVIYFRKRFRLRWRSIRWRIVRFRFGVGHISGLWVRCRILVDRLWDWFMNRLWAWFWFRDWARVHRRHIRWWSWRSWLI